MNLQRFLAKASTTPEIQAKLKQVTSVNEVIEVGREYGHYFTEKDVFSAAQQEETLKSLPFYSQRSFQQKVKDWIRDHIVDDDPWDEP